MYNANITKRTFSHHSVSLTQTYTHTHTQPTGEVLQWLLQVICHHSNIEFNLAEDGAGYELNTLCAVFGTSEQVQHFNGQKVGPPQQHQSWGFVQGARANISPSIDDRL